MKPRLTFTSPWWLMLAAELCLAVVAICGCVATSERAPVEVGGAR